MADSVTLNYSEAGQGTPVILLHGFPLSGAIWHEQQQRLSDRYRVITPDLRGQRTRLATIVRLFSDRAPDKSAWFKRGSVARPA